MKHTAPEAGFCSMRLLNVANTSWQVVQRDSATLIAVSQVHLYFVKRSMSEPIAMVPQVWKIHYISAGVANVPECQTTLMQASLHAV